MINENILSIFLLWTCFRLADPSVVEERSFKISIPTHQSCTYNICNILNIFSSSALLFEVRDYYLLLICRLGAVKWVSHSTAIFSFLFLVRGFQHYKPWCDNYWQFFFFSLIFPTFCQSSFYSLFSF